MIIQAIKVKGGRIPKGGYLARRDQKLGNKTYTDQGSDKKLKSFKDSTSGLRNSGPSESRPSTPVNGKNEIELGCPRGP